MHVKSASDRVSEITHQIEQSILTGELAIGEYLPAEQTLCTRLGATRAVVREALERLSHQGLIESQPGNGSRVAPPGGPGSPGGRQNPLDYERQLRSAQMPLEDLTVVRFSLETTIASLAAEHRTQRHLEQLEGTQRTLSNPRKSLAAHVKADAEFHELLAEASGNRVFPLVLAPIHDLLTGSRLKTLQRYGAALAFAHHQQILDAVRDQDPSAAAAAMREHLGVNSRHLEAMSHQRASGRPR
ncbi:MAG: FadR/GntR family transcriptional regulator [Planctomycetales bacterium]